MLEAHLLLCPTRRLQLTDLPPPVAAPGICRRADDLKCPLLRVEAGGSGWVQSVVRSAGDLAIVKLPCGDATGVGRIQPILLCGG
jgi:hypothetical protein